VSGDATVRRPVILVHPVWESGRRKADGSHTWIDLPALLDGHVISGGVRTCSASVARGIVRGMGARRSIQCMDATEEDAGWTPSRRTSTSGRRRCSNRDIELNGVIVHTAYDGQADIEMMEASLEVGDVIAEHGARPEGRVRLLGQQRPGLLLEPAPGQDHRRRRVRLGVPALLRDGAFRLIFYYEPAPTRRASWRTSRTRATTSQASRVDRSGESWSGRVRIDRQDQSAPEFAAGRLYRPGPTIGHDRGSGPVDRGILNAFQGGFPVTERPFDPRRQGSVRRGST